MTATVIPIIGLCILLASCSEVPGDAAFRAGRYDAAFRLYKSEYQQGNVAAGIRLANMYSNGIGVAKDSAESASIYLSLATKGVLLAQHNIGVCYEYGDGVKRDYSRAAEWYEKAALRGYIWSIYNLGTLYSNGHLVPADDVKGLALLLAAESLATGDDESARTIREDRLGHVKRLKSRMSSDQIAAAETRAQRMLAELNQNHTSQP